MPRIQTPDELGQLNKALIRIDKLEKQLRNQQLVTGQLGYQVSQLDYAHHKPTTNNLSFTWTGGTTTLSWVKGFLRDKNASAQKDHLTAKSMAPGAVHTYPVAAGSLVLSASTYYWLGWDPVHTQMVANTDASKLLENFNILIVCRLFTGTAGQTGTAGGGGSNSGVDLSGLTYKNF